jgi:hypothetical protein
MTIRGRWGKLDREASWTVGQVGPWGKLDRGASWTVGQVGPWGKLDRGASWTFVVFVLVTERTVFFSRYLFKFTYWRSFYPFPSKVAVNLCFCNQFSKTHFFHGVFNVFFAGCKFCWHVYL